MILYHIHTFKPRVLYDFFTGDWRVGRGECGSSGSSEKRPCWNLGTVILMGVMSAKLLIYIYKIFSSSSSSREKIAWFQGSSEKRAISLLQKLLVVHRVFPLSCSHNFLGSLLLKNAGTLEPWNRTSKKPCKSSTYTVPIFSKNGVSPERETLNSVLGLEPYQFP